MPEADGPQDLWNVPRVRLGRFPTPLRQVSVLGKGAFWCKDDGRSAHGYGGNKVRKLEYLLAEAKAQDASRLIVWGDTESHTVLATACFGRQLGFDVTAVLYPSRVTDETERCMSLLGRRGVRIVSARTMAGALLRARVLANQKSTYLIPVGGSCPLSTVGYVEASMELSRQLRACPPPWPTHIYAALGSGGTVAGILLGLAISGQPLRVIAVRTVGRLLVPEDRIRRLIAGTAKLLGQPMDLCRNAWDHLERVDSRFLGRGYRDTPPDSLLAVETIKDVRLEPFFTGKTAAALLRDLADKPGSQLLLWNTHCANHDDLVAGIG